MASIQSRKDGTKVIRWRCPVTRKNKQYTPKDQRKKWIERLVREIERSCDEGVEWTPPSARFAGQPSLIEMINADLTDRARSRSPAYITTLEIVFGLFIDSIEHHGTKEPTAQHLTRQSLANYYDYLVNVRASCRPATASSRVKLVQGLWRRLHEHDEYGDWVPRPRSLPDLPSTQSPHLPAPTWEEMDAAVAHGWGWYAELLLVGRYTGLRRSQIMRLRWDDLDFERKLLRVRPALGKTRAEKKGRTIPVSDHLLTELAGAGVREGFLIDTGTPGRTCGNLRIQRAWARAGVREEVWAANEDRRGQPSHAMRHGFITGLLKAKADRDLVRYLVGHKGDVTTRYTDFSLLEDQLREVVSLIPPLTKVEVTLRNKGRGFLRSARFAPRSHTREQDTKKVLSIK